MRPPKYGTLEADRAIDEAIEADIDAWMEIREDERFKWREPIQDDFEFGE